MGETLRRLDWSGAEVVAEQLVARVDGLGRLQELAKDKWPGR